MAATTIPISLFQLSAEAWLSPQAVAQAVGAMEVSELLTRMKQIADVINEPVLNPNYISKFQQEAQNIFMEMVRRESWTQSLSPIFRPHTVIPFPPHRKRAADVQKFLQELPLHISSELDSYKGGPFFAEILDHAAKHGYLFPEGVLYCLKREDSMKAAEEIEGAIQSFKSGDLFDRQSIIELSEPERLAFYALVSEFFPGKMEFVSHYLCDELQLLLDGLRIDPKDFLRALAHFTNFGKCSNCLIASDPASSLSAAQKLAIYFIIRRKCGTVFSVEKHPSLSFGVFHWCLNLECSLAKIMGTALELEKFSQHLAREASLTHFLDSSDWVPTDEIDRRMLELSPFRNLRHLLTNIFATDVMIARVGSIIFDKDGEMLVSFGKNSKLATTGNDLQAAIELLEANMPLSDGLFRKYAKTPNRRQKMGRVKRRAKKLVSGARLKNLTDPFEMMAVLRILGKMSPSLDVVHEVLGQSHVPPRSESARYQLFSFSVPLVEPFYNIANKGLLAAYAQEIRDVSTLNGLVEALKNFTGNKKAKRTIQKYLDELESIPDEKGLTRERYAEEVGRARGILFEISNALVTWLWERTVHLGHKKAKEQAVREMDVYLKKILIAMVRWHAILEPDRYDKKKASQQETYRLLDQLSEYYLFGLRAQPEWVFHPHKPLPWPPSLDEIFNELNKMNTERERFQQTGRRVDITLCPIVGKLVAFYGYLSENCLARPDWAVHAMRDHGFVPYFILVDGECQGVVQTFTKFVAVNGMKKKVLIVTGVDPQIRFTPDPSSFMRGLEEGFSRIAAEGGYDLVMVPALDFAQSSRRALLRHEFNRYTEKIRIDEPIGFPQVGVHEDGRPIYYHNEAHGETKHQEFLVFRSPQ